MEAVAKGSCLELELGYAGALPVEGGNKEKTIKVNGVNGGPVSIVFLESYHKKLHLCPMLSYNLGQFRVKPVPRALALPATKLYASKQSNRDPNWEQ